MMDVKKLPEGDWENTPESVRQWIAELEATAKVLKAQLSVLMMTSHSIQAKHEATARVLKAQLSEAIITSDSIQQMASKHEETAKILEAQLTKVCKELANLEKHQYNGLYGTDG